MTRPKSPTPSGVRWGAVALSGLLMGLLLTAGRATTVDAQEERNGPSNPDAITATFAADIGTLGAIPDSDVISPVCQNNSTTFKDVTFTVSGLAGTVHAVSVDFMASHPYLQDLEVTLIAPTAESHLLFSATGTTSSVANTCSGSSSDLLATNTYTFDDTASANWWVTAVASPVPTSVNRTVVTGIGGTPFPPATTSMNATFSGVAPNGTWVLRFRDRGFGDTGTVAAANLTISVSALFTDDPLVPGATVVKAGHITELRTRVNVARTARGMSAAVFTDTPLPPNSVAIKAVHITQLRTALDEIYAHDGVSHAAYTDPSLSVGTKVKVQHVAELRTFLLGIGG